MASYNRSYSVLKWKTGIDENFDARAGTWPILCAECGLEIDGDPVIYRDETYHVSCLAQFLERGGLRR
ncbi:hypothetical protein AKJ66_00435 [candidate division MSBL1 archaeon SCGC-AAA259E22]|uniref:LIM zinc-binding domain-containing protein n=1 Tax=candidate division MSBL1 archaeon SCGC-AAA259E22 TaxID=1698265 RepID=A0A133UIG1_9EURY|nr:hypothetical protein AKJ66_00435 [candidate division MSBL1 archaeon SCGC-AAA259E22]